MLFRSEHVYDQLQPVADLVGRLEERDAALEAYHEARRDIRYRVREIDEEIAELERLSRLGDADLDAPTEQLREPIEAYNDAVTGAFAEFRRNSPAREVLAFVAAMGDYPLVPFEQPPEELLRYAKEREPGNETISQLLEYADYSESKLGHYVDDPGLLKRRVATNRTYLQGLDAAPFRIEWPPSNADLLRYRTEELLSVVTRFADEKTTRALRAVRECTRREDYRRLREAAVADARLCDDDRDRLESGEVSADLAAAREERDRVVDAVERHPEP